MCRLSRLPSAVSRQKAAPFLTRTFGEGRGPGEWGRGKGQNPFWGLTPWGLTLWELTLLGVDPLGVNLPGG